MRPYAHARYTAIAPFAFIRQRMPEVEKHHHGTLHTSPGLVQKSRMTFPTPLRPVKNSPDWWQKTNDFGNLPNLPSLPGPLPPDGKNDG